MRFTFIALVGLVFTGSLAACGGGGGGEEPAATAPGILRTLALQGQTAPDTTGVFAAFETDPPMDVADGGWAAFIAGTTDVTAAQCAYVALPDGTLRVVWRTGDTVPDAGGGTINDILSVRVNSGGLVLVYVDITGDAGGRTEGLLSARVESGAIVDRHDVLYDTRPMGDVGLTGTLANILDGFTVLMDDGWIFVDTITTLGEESLLRVQADGTSVTSLAKLGDALAGGDTFLNLRALAVDPVGNRFAFLAERQDNSYGLYVGIVGLSLYSALFEEGDDLSVGIAVDLPIPQALYIDVSGYVLFKAVSSESRDHLCITASGATAPAYYAVEGDVDPVTGGVFQDLEWIHNQRGSSLPLFMADVGANAEGISFGIYAAILSQLPGTVTAALAMWDNLGAPAGLGANLRFTSTFPGVGGAGRRDSSSTGAFAFANVLSNGRPGAFWRIPSLGLFTIAAGGLEIPGGGDTFDGLSTWRVTTAKDVMLFRAPVVGAGSGIFRRGP